MKSFLDTRDRTEAIDRILRVGPTSSRRWGTMTPHEMLCHLADSFATMLGDRESRDVSTFTTRTFVRFIAMSTPLAWPRGFATMREVDPKRDGTTPAEFAADQVRLRRILESFVPRLEPSTMRHPIFGRLGRGEWGRWAYRHVDHHARQFGV